VAKMFNSTKPPKLLHKRLLSDGFHMAVINNYLMKNHSPQMLSCTL